MGYFDIQSNSGDNKTHDKGYVDIQNDSEDNNTHNDSEDNKNHGKGYFDIQNDPEDDGKLDLIKFENRFVNTMNEVIDNKIKSEIKEFGIRYIEDDNKKEVENKEEEDNKKKGADVYSFNGEKVKICPEPLEFIKKYDDISDNVGEVQKRFKENMKGFLQIELNKSPLSEGGKLMWRNKTTEGINLRPGNLNDNKEKFDPIKMSDENVHGLIVGRTGSGKSVFINAILLSLITEYSPWELNLYLADFKKVELSRYMNDSDEMNGGNPFTPHVNACAATSEIRYVVSLIRYIVDCMNARQEFFARIGVTKIQEFREKYDVVLPRVLLVVDEFQQMFKEATSREADEISVMLNSITKLGRATGFHLIFASQEMSGTLGGNTLANFKIRMALPCNQDISSGILGNSAAAKLETGYVLINTEAGDEIQNQRYRVPYIETEIKGEKKKDSDNNKGNKKPPFYRYLNVIKKAAQGYDRDLDYKKSVQKFYQEDLQEKEEEYIKDLDDIRENKNKKVAEEKGLFDAVVLGKTVLYSPKANDKVSFYIETGRNKGIMIACSEPDNAARVRKLLAENLLRSDQETDHFGMEINDLVKQSYRMEEEIKKYPPKYPKQRYYSCDIEKGVKFLEMMYYLRSNLIISEKEKEDFRKKERLLINSLKDNEKKKKYEEYIESLNRINENISALENNIRINMERQKEIQTPIVPYLKKCSRIYVEEDSRTKADIFELSEYSKIVEIFSEESEIGNANDKSVNIIKEKIEALKNEKENGTDEEKREKNFQYARYSVFRTAVNVYSRMFRGEDTPHNDSPKKEERISRMKEIFHSLDSYIEKFKNEKNEQNEITEKLAELNESKEEYEDQLDTYILMPDPIAVEKDAIERSASEYIRSIFEKAYELSNYQEGKKEIPSLVFEYDEEKEQLVWKYEKDFSDTCLQTVAEDLLDRYISICSMERDDRKEFKKTVFWINGLDAIEKFPSKFDEVVRDAINQNILVVAIITSELSDSYMRKLFDYAFVTGNIEKFYDMFNIRYTKQASDSIVVNFGIVSKGMNIPFKMYKTKLDTPEMSGFMDDLDALKNR